MDSETAATGFYSSPQDMEHMLSKELHQLSFNDRNAIQEEIHGVRNAAPEETPEGMEEGLAQLQQELQAIPPNQKAAYTKACLSPQSYVHDRSFLLKFLRADLYDCKAAARCGYWRWISTSGVPSD